MARQVEPRQNYQADANFLIRVAKAVEIDTRLAIEVRRQLLYHLNSASAIMLTDVAKQFSDKVKDG